MIWVPLKYGVVGAGLVMVMFLTIYLLGKNPLFTLQTFDFGLIPLFLFFAIKDFRDTHNERVLHFWQGMTAGFFVYVSIALLSSLFIFLFLELADRNIVADFITNRVEMLERSREEMTDGLGKEAFDKVYIELQKTTPYILAMDNFLKKAILGLSFTILISVILRKQPKN